MTHPTTALGPLALALLALALAAAGCTPPPALPVTAVDAQALQIIQRAAAAPASLEHASVDMEQVEITHIAAEQSSLSATEKKRLAGYVRTPQPDGSAVYSYRVRGHFEHRAPGFSWIRLQRIGAGEHSNVIFADGQSNYYFDTRFPDNISRTPVAAREKRGGAPALSWLGAALTEESKQATALRSRGREVLLGELCEVIDLTIPTNKDDPQSTERHLTYYIGVTDGLVRRCTEASGPSERLTYSETTLKVDPTFIPDNINYARFEAEVKLLLKAKGLPPIVAKME